MAEKRHEGGVSYHVPDKDYFEKRELRRHAGVFALWALGVGAVISGDFSGWNLGFAVGGWGGMFVATIIIAIMYLGLTYSIAEMSPALPHTGGAYSFARTAFGPWGGFITGIAENIEYVLTPAVVVYFIGTYMTAIVGTPNAFQPVWWIIGYVIFVGLNVRGVALSFKVTVIVTLIAIAILVFFLLSALFSGQFDFAKWAMNIGVGPDGAAVALPDGHGPFLPFGVYGVLAALPFAVWLFLAIEQLPLAAEESVDPKRDMPKGIMLGMFTLIALGFAVLIINPAIPMRMPPGPLPTAPRASRFSTASALSMAAAGRRSCRCSRSPASSPAFTRSSSPTAGRSTRCRARATSRISCRSPTARTRRRTLLWLRAAWSGLAVMLVVWFAMGGEAAGTFIGSVLLNMAVFGAMFSYLLQALTFLQLRRRFPNIERPYRSPFGVLGASLTVIIALVTIYFQLTDPLYRQGVIGVAIWYILAIVYFAAYGRKTLVFSPEEAFAVKHREGAVKV